MTKREPAWWYDPSPNVISRMLGPAAAVWGDLVRRRHVRATPYRAQVPVICVGNFTVGGTGKTPLALEVASIVVATGLRPAFLSRGYGGRLPGPHWVDPNRDHARDVGDEPLLLAAFHPTLICRDRVAGVRAITQSKSAGEVVDVIVMDDGLQNPSLAKDLTLAVVDGARGIGNGRVIPAGPLRAPLAFQLALVDAIVVNRGPTDATESSFTSWLRREFDGPVLEASVVPQGDIDWLKEAPVVAFAGIGVPDRFFATLAALGAPPVARMTFPDHHAFTATDAMRLLDLAAAHNATLVTTVKDRARLAGGSGPTGELHARSRALPIRLALDSRDEGRLAALVEGAIGRRTPKPR